MTTLTDVVTIEEKAYSDFKKGYGEKKFGDQRYGQAFFNHFNLEKMNHKGRYDKLYNSTSITECVSLIRKEFTFH